MSEFRARQSPRHLRDSPRELRNRKIMNTEETDDETDEEKKLTEEETDNENTNLTSDTQRQLQFTYPTNVRYRQVPVDSIGKDDPNYQNYKTFPYIPESNDVEYRLSRLEEVQNSKSSKLIGKGNNIIIFSIIAIIILFFGGSIYLKGDILEKEYITTETIHKKYPKQPIETLEIIEAVIDDVLKLHPIHPAVFLFIFDKNTENNNFIMEIANFASAKLKVSNDHIILNEDVYSKPEVKKDYGHLIDMYKHELEKKKVMVIKDLHKMPGTTAQAFHSFCDEITPLVNRAVYIFTLKVDAYSGKEIHTAEKQLYKVWNDLKTDILAPLVTRVTSTVIKIH